MSVRPDKALMARRVEEILRIRLDGAQGWDVLEYVRAREKEPESNWFVSEGKKPLCDSSIWRYLQLADKLMLESHESSLKKIRRRHLVQRRHLYARAITVGDLGTAARVLKDEAELMGLYPPKRQEVTGKGGLPLQLQVVEEIVHVDRAGTLPVDHRANGLPQK